MSYSQAELDALKSAYAQGVTRVAYDGKVVDYASGDDLWRRIQQIEGEINAGSGSRPVARFATFRRD